jgi:hypothetical protein
VNDLGTAHRGCEIGDKKRRTMQQPDRHEFRAVIEGIELSPETVHSIDKAVQRAVLSEIASIELDRSVTLYIPPIPEDKVQKIDGEMPYGMWVQSDPGP